MEIYLKKAMDNRVITAVAKVTELATIEVGGGAIETYQDPSEVTMAGYMERGFVECPKDEYDQVVKRVVLEVNALI